MAYLPDEYNPSEHDPMRDFSAIPPGEYLARIIKTEMKPTRDNTGQYLQIEFEVLTESFKGSRLWARLNLVNKNAEAVKIAKQELRSISDALGITQAWRDSNILHGKPLIVKVRLDPATDKYPEGNSITNYSPAGNMGANVSPTQAKSQPRPDWAGGAQNTAAPESQDPKAEAQAAQAEASAEDTDKPAWA